MLRRVEINGTFVDSAGFEALYNLNEVLALREKSEEKSAKPSVV